LSRTVLEDHASDLRGHRHEVLLGVRVHRHANLLPSFLMLLLLLLLLLLCLQQPLLSFELAPPRSKKALALAGGVGRIDDR
jgi:hypothetical protein